MKNNMSGDLPNKKEVQNINPYQKKVLQIKRKTIMHAIYGLFLVASIVALDFYSDAVKKDSNLDISDLKALINDLNAKSANIETKINDAKRFKQVWVGADEKKKNFNGIKVADINNSFDSLVDSYGIVKPIMSISVPEVLKDGIYKQLQALNVNLVNFSISFQSVTDKVAIDFINSFIEKLPGYVVINNLSVKRDKKDGYSDQDLVGISKGSFAGITSVKVNFAWYFLQQKTTSKSK